jgi:hypothetical protein
VVVTISDSWTMGMAAIQLGLQNMITSAQRGHISPADVDKALDGVMATLENLAPAVQGNVIKHLDPQFATLKRIAAENWKV